MENLTIVYRKTKIYNKGVSITRFFGVAYINLTLWMRLF